MQISFDPQKRALTLENRGLDFEDARRLFDNLVLTVEDDRKDYGETRYQSIGLIGSSLVMVVWTPRGTVRHIISMRYCNAKERTLYQIHMDRSGRGARMDI